MKAMADIAKLSSSRPRSARLRRRRGAIFSSAKRQQKRVAMTANVSVTGRILEQEANVVSLPCRASGPRAQRLGVGTRARDAHFPPKTGWCVLISDFAGFA